MSNVPAWPIIEGSWVALAALLVAILLDVTVGEPPAALHPVVWMGRFIALCERRAPAGGRHAQFLYGATMLLAGLAMAGVAPWLLLRWLGEISPWLVVVVGGFLLKTSLSLSCLADTARGVAGKLGVGALAEARSSVGALVSRPTAALSAGHVAAATVESVAENSTDSVVAPLLYFALFGVPGAMLYRMANTFDAMIGYHGRYEYLGKPAARVDDALNYVPARLSALMLVAAAAPMRLRVREAWRTMWRDHGRTESPNAGWTMSAAAGALGLRLEKPGHYCLGEALAQPDAMAIRRMVRLLWGTAALAVALTVLYEVLRGIMHA